jgi:Zn-dependent protease with chaperone function
VSVCLGLAAMAVLAFGPAGVLLERARWPERAPRAAIALWQALGVAGALAAAGAGLALAAAPLHRGLVPGTIVLLEGATRRRPAAVRGIDEAFGLTLAATVVAVLVVGMVITMARTISSRRRHRILLDLVARRSELAPGAVLLDDPRAAAYCLPGVRSRIVVSTGAFALLDDLELAAVLAHERGHLHERHDLVLLPFASMIEMLEWMPYVRRAPAAVSLLLEMAADDYAARNHRPRVLASVLVHMSGSGAVPSCAFAAASGVTRSRVRRLVAPRRNSRLVATVAVMSSLVLVAMPAFILGSW